MAVSEMKRQRVDQGKGLSEEVKWSEQKEELLTNGPEHPRLGNTRPVVFSLVRTLIVILQTENIMQVISNLFLIIYLFLLGLTDYHVGFL